MHENSPISRRTFIGATAAVALATAGCNAPSPTNPNTPSDAEADTISLETIQQDVCDTVEQASTMLAGIAPGKLVRFENPNDPNPSANLHANFPSATGDTGSLASLSVTKGPDGLFSVMCTTATAYNAAMSAAQKSSVIPYKEYNEVVWNAPEGSLADAMRHGALLWSDLLTVMKDPQQSVLQLDSLSSATSSGNTITHFLNDGVSVEIPPQDALYAGKPGFSAAYRQADACARAVLQAVKQS